MRIYPPVYFLAAAAVMAALHFYFPLAQWLQPPLSYAGYGLFALGVVIVIATKRRFDAADTTIKPFEESTALLTDGLYRFSRNPIYVCMVLGLIGVFIAFGSLSPVIVIPVFFWIIHSRIIPIEERMLEDTFGEEYRAYKSSVRRWL